MPSQDAKARREECRRPLAASYLVSRERGGCDFIGNTLGPTPQNCVRRWKILAQSLQKVCRVEQVSFPVLLIHHLTGFLTRMLAPVGEREVCKAWEGFQCGFCGAEFKTKEKLKQHQFSNHGSTRPAGPVVGET